MTDSKQPNQEIDEINTRIHSLDLNIFRIEQQLNNINPENSTKYKSEYDYIVRYLTQEGYSVDDSLFETIVSIINKCRYSGS